MNMWGRRTGLEKILIICILLVSIIAIAFIIAYVTKSSSSYSNKMSFDPNRESNIRNSLFSNLAQTESKNGILSGSAANMRDTLRVLTKQEHYAGTEAQLNTMDYVKQKYKSFGLDRVQYTEYEVLLNFPNTSQPNTVLMKNSSGSFLLSAGVGQSLGPQEAQAQQNASASAKIWWNAFARPGSVSGSLVYANHGTLDDYKYLTSQNISLNNTIVLVRYGKLWRGAKVYEAERLGAKGVILFSDPEDYGPPPGMGPFPQSHYLPPTGAQRGTLSMGDGDQATPFYPAKPYVHREFTIDDLRQKLLIPNVPVMPIGYADAQNILATMDGHTASDAFQGGINVTGGYKLTSSAQYTLNVHGIDNPRAKIKNVIGYVIGTDEPEKLILVSNHVDAWTYGSHDPNSGTTVILEMSKALMTTINQTGWRPRRTIVFCSWDAEEYGLIGSNEWSEEYLKVLESNAVALVNVDIAVKGTKVLEADVVPLLYQVLIKAAKQVANPNLAELTLGRNTVYDTWIQYNNSMNVSDVTMPFMGIPGSGSDHTRFLNFIGIPVIDMSYRYQPRSYDLYHTMYEVSWLIENVVDQNFTTHVAMAQLWVEVIRDLADSVIIPFNVVDYGFRLRDTWIPMLLKFFRDNNVDNLIIGFNNKANLLTNATQRFLSSAQIIQNYAKQINAGKMSATVPQIRALNRVMLGIERSFINPRGLPGRSDYRHVVFASSVHDAYSGVLFAGITDAIEDYKTAKTTGNTSEMNRLLKVIQLALTDVNFAIESAILHMDIFGLF